MKMRKQKRLSILILVVLASLFSVRLSYANKYDSLLNTKWKFVGYKYKDTIKHCPPYVIYTLEFTANHTVKGFVSHNYEGRYKIRDGKLKLKNINIRKSSNDRLSSVEEIQTEFTWRLWFMRDIPTTSYKKFSLDGHFLRIFISEQTTMLFSQWNE